MAANSALRQGRAALIFGASGITGWAIAREAAQYPSTDAFTRIIGLTNRPLERESARLPDDNRIQLVSGLDLTAGVSAVTSKLQAIDGIEDVTDVYFAAYIQPPGTSDIEGFEELKRVNVEILETAIHAVEAVCPQLRSWSLQTGGKSYGFVHVREIGLPKVPCKESEPRIPQPYADSVFYYAQHDALARLSSGKRWKFVEIRPDAVIGFVPTSNAMNLAQTLGIFLSFYASEKRAKSPSGAIQVPYPGPVAAYIAHHTDISQRTLAQAHLFFAGAVGSETTVNGEIYNVGDTSSAGTSWAEKWARLCEYFQLEGTGPAEDGSNEPLHVGEYMWSRRDQWEKWEKDNGLQQGVVQGASWEFLDVMLGLTVFDRQYDLSKADGAGFLAKQDVVGSYFGVFDAMRGAKMIP